MFTDTKHARSTTSFCGSWSGSVGPNKNTQLNELKDQPGMGLLRMELGRDGGSGHPTRTKQLNPAGDSSPRHATHPRAFCNSLFGGFYPAAGRTSGMISETAMRRMGSFLRAEPCGPLLCGDSFEHVLSNDDLVRLFQHLSQHKLPGASWVSNAFAQVGSGLGSPARTPA